MELLKLSATDQISLMVYYRDHSMFDTTQPEIYISRLKGLLAIGATAEGG